MSSATATLIGAIIDVLPSMIGLVIWLVRHHK